MQINRRSVAISLRRFIDEDSTMRSDRFQFRDPRLWCARARLHPNRLELTGWYWRGCYRRLLPLHRIIHVDVPGEDELLIWLMSGETVRLQINEPNRWKTAIEAGQASLDSPPSH